MSIFLYHRPTNTMRAVSLDHDTCLGLASHWPAHKLSKDIEAWHDKAKHNDRLEITSDLMLIALEL